MGKLSGKIAIVTGASSGVGAGIAKVLAAHGASVVLCARRQEKLDEIRREIENRDNEGEVMTVACDVVDDARSTGPSKQQSPASTPFTFLSTALRARCCTGQFPILTAIMPYSLTRPDRWPV